MPHDERALTRDFLRALMREQYRVCLEEDVDKEKWPNAADRQVAVDQVTDTIVSATGLHPRDARIEIIKNKLENETDTILARLVDLAPVAAQLKKWYKDNVESEPALDLDPVEEEALQESNERICERDLTKDFLNQILSE